MDFGPVELIETDFPQSEGILQIVEIELGVDIGQGHVLVDHLRVGAEHLLALQGHYQVI